MRCDRTTTSEMYMQVLSLAHAWWPEKGYVMQSKSETLVPCRTGRAGSTRRECLDHIIVWNERSLCRILQSYFVYYQHSRTHLALAKDAPESRVVEKPERGRVVAIPQVGGLHHSYQRQAA
jgi:hypothetical protein